MRTAIGKHNSAVGTVRACVRVCVCVCVCVRERERVHHCTLMGTDIGKHVYTVGKIKINLMLGIGGVSYFEK